MVIRPGGTRRETRQPGAVRSDHTRQRLVSERQIKVSTVTSAGGQPLHILVNAFNAPRQRHGFENGRGEGRSGCHQVHPSYRRSKRWWSRSSKKTQKCQVQSRWLSDSRSPAAPLWPARCGRCDARPPWPVQPATTRRNSLQTSTPEAIDFHQVVVAIGIYFSGTYFGQGFGVAAKADASE